MSDKFLQIELLKAAHGDCVWLEYGTEHRQWRLLIDGSAANDGADALKATAKPLVARLSPATASGLGLTEGDDVTITAGGGQVTLPLFVEDSMVDGVVWIPGNRLGEGLGELRVTAGQTVTVTGGAA